jgi:hypothetical protein
MADVWDVGVASIDVDGNLHLDGTVIDNGGGNYLTVTVGNDPLVNADNLRSTYAEAKTALPNGNAISKSNRSVVLLPPAQYDTSGSPLVLDTEFVDLIATNPQLGGESGELTEAQGNKLANYKPPCTVISSSISGSPTVEQSAEDVRLRGFGISFLNDVANGTNAVSFACSAAKNDNSIYDKMYFFAAAATIGYPTRFTGHFRGYWTHCIANSFAFRTIINSSDFEPTMIDCVGGALSFIGDSTGVATNMDCYLLRCRAGDQSFAGCNSFTGPIKSEALFVDCTGLDRCFGQASESAGTFIRCRAGDYSFGGNFSATLWPQGPQNFSGYAEDCFAGTASFGGSGEAAVPGSITGELVRCTTTGNTLPLHAAGATIRDSRIENSTLNVDAIELDDDDSKIINTTVEVNDSGTGLPINAGAAQNVIAVSCTFNNGDNDANGLGANVTNLATNPTNGVY